MKDKETRVLRKTPKQDCAFICVRGFLGGTSQHNPNYQTLPP